MYRAQFAKTIPESKLQEPYAKKLVGMLSGFVAVSVMLFAFLRKYSKFIGLCHRFSLKGTLPAICLSHKRMMTYTASKIDDCVPVISVSQGDMTN